VAASTSEPRTEACPCTVSLERLVPIRPSLQDCEFDTKSRWEGICHYTPRDQEKSHTESYRSAWVCKGYKLTCRTLACVACNPLAHTVLTASKSHRLRCSIFPGYQSPLYFRRPSPPFPLPCIHRYNSCTLMENGLGHMVQSLAPRLFPSLPSSHIS
jgi:hypothetical protein